MQAAESRLKEIGAQKKIITDYLKTKDTFAEWRKSGFSQRFYEEHEQQILIHKAAKKVFDGIQGKIPKLKDLTAEYNKVLEQKQKDYRLYRESRAQMRELLNVKANIDTVMEKTPAERKSREKITR